MSDIIKWLESVFDFLPLPLLEVWGRFSYIIGSALAISAFGGFTFRPGGRWGFGRERQAWDVKAVISIPVTFILIVATGYIGSFIVLVPGAQTFESLKDLAVFLCIVLFGYPALIAVPFAYGISDLIEGVPPGSLLAWLPGYFINPACFWVAYQFFGKNPDFRRARVWGWYLLFVLIFMSIEPVLWGYICAGKFTSAVSFGNISPALFFTTGITWLIAPLVMLVALPLARKFGMFWAEIPGHVKERLLGRKDWVWEAGTSGTRPEIASMNEGWPIRIVFLAPFIALVLLMVGATAYVTLRSAADDAHKLATQLHEEISGNINLQLDEYLANKPNADDAVIPDGINTLLKGLPIAKHCVALVVNRTGNIIASSANIDDPVSAKAITHLHKASASLDQLKEGFQFRFDYITEKPLSREGWLARATFYEDRSGGHADWMVVTLMPESFYLAGVQAGNSRSAMVFAVALLLSLAVAAILAAMVTNPLRRISLATQALAQGNLDQHAPGSRIEELTALSHSFNDMAERLKKSFDHLNDEIQLREQAEESLRMMQFSVDHAGDSIFWVSREGRILYVNDAVCAGRGYTREELLGMMIYDLNPDFSPDRYDQYFKDLQEYDTLKFESHHRTKDGTVFPVEISANYVSIGGQEISFSTVRDITERKRAEEELAHSEELFRTSFENATVGVCLVATNGRFLNVNSTLCDMLGYSKDELVQLTVNDVTHDDDKEISRTFFANMLSGGPKSMQIEKRYLRKDGQIVWAYLSTVLIEKSKDHGSYLISYIQDITARKQAAEQLEMLKCSIDQHFDGAYWMDSDDRFVYVNDSACKALGYTREELLGQPMTMVATNASQDLRHEIWRALRETGFYTRETVHRRKDGSEIPVEIVASYVRFEDKEFNCGFARDITERKRAERSLRESEDRYKTIISVSNTGAWEYHLDSGYLWCSPEYFSMLGRNQTDYNLLGENNLQETWGDLLHPDDREQAMNHFAEYLKNGSIGTYESYFRLQHRDGSWVWVWSRGQTLRDAQGNLTNLTVGTHIDITERKRAEEELISKTALLEAQVDSTIDGIMVVDGQGRRILQNQRFCEMFKVPETIASDDDQTKLLQHAINQIRDPQTFSERVAHLYAHPDEIGRDEIEMADGRILDRYSAPVLDKAGKHYGRIWTFRDITGQRKLEEQFRQSQKMDAVGQLASGVAHDFNNVLAVIQMQAGMLKMAEYLQLSLARVMDGAAEIEKASQRAANLTRQLLLFSRQQAVQLHEVDLNDSIVSITRMLQRVLGEGIQMQFKYAPHPLFINADAGMLDQVLLNLTVNARDAMPDGGNIFIETSAVEFDEAAAARTPDARPGCFVCLSVSDTGCGMSPEIQARIFEPFFTTKDIGKGTGLGLATVFGIVQQHQGWVDVHSEVGHGTVFQVYLPLIPGSFSQKIEEVMPAPIHGGYETILLVEDDPFLRASIQQALSNYGYHIFEAATGLSALEVWKHKHGEIDLLLTDMMMPDGMNGKELARRLLQESPELKVIYMSGYSKELTGKDSPFEESVNFIMKPFQPDRLAQVIRDCLDQ